MDNKFIETLEYLRNLKSEIISSSLCVEERILIDIKRAVLEDIFNRGSIILTKDEFGYKVSNIQKHSYAWKFKDMYIDLGVDSKEEVESLGIRPGDMITPYIEFRKMANEKYLLAKAWDNRIGCAVAIEVLNHLKDEKHPNIVYGVGTVQEEVGCRGALTTSQMINPSIVFALDVGLAGDVPGVTNQIQAKMGKGPIITLIDGGLIGHKGLRDFVVNVAEELNIPYQFDVTPGGATDAAKMHLVHDGAPAMSVGIASRYIHSHTSMIHRDDYENTVKLLTEVVRRLDKEAVHKITFES